MRGPPLIGKLPLPPRAQGADWAPPIQQIQRRSRLYLAQLPPDQLNPRGHHDAGLYPVFERPGRKRRRTLGGGDARSGCLPLELPEPGGCPARLYQSRYLRAKP